MLNWLNKGYLLVSGFSFLFLINISVLLLINSPAKIANACVQGGNFTLINLGLAIVISLLLSLSLAGLLHLLRMKKQKNNINLVSIGGVGMFFWFLSTMCLACYIPIIGIFGFSLSLNFLTGFEVWFRGVSLVLSILSLWMVDRQIRFGCLNPKKCDV